MAKVALLIGVSEYEPGLIPLPAAINDVEAMQEVLQHPEIGGFDEVTVLVNPQRQEMEEAVETLFGGRQKDDLVLLFFSGHGIKDEEGNLYFATHNTRKTLLKSTTVRARFVHDVMNKSRSKREVVILDCCFSGAFAEGMLARDDGFVDVKNQLGGEGRAVLTSSTSTQYSFEQPGADISTYTRYIVEGLKTGAADRDEDGKISVDELHEYAKSKVQEAAPAMKPEIYAIKEGYKINLAKAPIDDPELKYRREVEFWVESGKGEISDAGRDVLDELRHNLGLTSEEAVVIEGKVLEPHREYQRKLKRYQERFIKEIQREYPISDNTREQLKRFQKVLGFTDENIALIEAPIIAKKPLTLPPVNPLPRQNNNFLQYVGACIIGVVIGGTVIYALLHKTIPPIVVNSCVKESYIVGDRISLGEKILLVKDTNSDKEAGVKAFANGDCKTAIDKFNAYRTANRTDPEALIYLNNAKARQQQQQLKIAVSVPIGTNPNVAKEILRGVAHVQDQVNSTGGINGKALEVAIANDDDSEDTAKEIATVLVNKQDILGVVGPCSSAASKGASTIYNNSKLVAISPTSTAVTIPGANNSYVFRTVPSDAVAAKQLADFMVNKLQKTKVAFFYNSKNNYSKSFISQFKSYAGFDINGDNRLNFDLSTEDFDPNNSIKQASQEGAEVLLIAPDSHSLDKALQVVHHNNNKIPILGGDDVYKIETLQVGKKAEKMILAIPWHIQNAQNSNFVKNSDILWKAPVSWRTATAYDATMAIITGLQQKTTRDGLKQMLHSPNFSADGATGKIKFAQSGDRADALTILIKVQQKPGTDQYEFVPIQP
ncbi:ABC transporter substrate-binding protein [Nostoc sp. CENA67]|uniref:ABC transporter substrate-binding protein n=1 Tax=Amazonocrinis nigriterrae CENA67 TaxID=2794033 RepID=A0A8J7HVM6_9NOST|nr:ABC transporter substrate-binding protein [Amazonocrinis nigriterrae]MBH8566377.1 ABC transporter substrate-binding protein [Amazonocrinis nigriterrae CENA67]